MKYADLHVHTFYSDSTFSPEEVVACANSRGLSAIAICDHDCLDGIAPSMEAASLLGMEIIPALELTVEKQDVEIHILGYFIDYKLGWLRKELKKMRDFRVERVHKMVAKLNESGLKISPDDVFKVAGKGSVGRLHVARAMLNTGNIRTFREAFDKYIGFLKPCYVSNIKFSPQEAIGLVTKAGGVGVLAHPGVMKRDDCIPELVEYGLRGIEVFHIEHKANKIEHYKKIARRYGLIETGGSDCHGMGKGRVLLGEVRMPYDTVERLREESGKIRNGQG